MALFIYAAHQILAPARFSVVLAVGAATYVLYSQICRRVVTKRARRGFRLMKQGAFSEAIAEYEAAYEFFSRHPWIDRFRYITLLSSSAYSYREAALCNIAFAYSQLGDGENAVKFYQRALREFPNCALAKTALRGVDALDESFESRSNLQSGQGHKQP